MPYKRKRGYSRVGFVPFSRRRRGGRGLSAAFKRNRARINARRIAKAKGFRRMRSRVRRSIRPRRPLGTGVRFQQLRKYRWTHSAALNPAAGVANSFVVDCRHALSPITPSHEANGLRLDLVPYDKYCVVAAHITLHTSSTSATPGMFGVFVGNADDQTNIHLKKTTTLLEQKRLKNARPIHEPGTTPVKAVATAKYDFKKWHGVDFDRDTLYAATTAAPPTAQYTANQKAPQFLVWAASMPGHDLGTVEMHMDIVFYVRMVREATTVPETIFGAP